MEKKIQLVNDTISNADIDKLISWLKTYPRLTKGEKTTEFEKKWSKWLGVKHSVYVNSGSSANLMMLYTLKLSKKLKNNKIVIPALSWATDLAPAIQLGFKPILADINLNDLSVDLKELERIFKTDNPSSIIIVSVLGLPPNMTQIKKLCNLYDVLMIEDVCESIGSKHNNKNIGTFGEMSSFSLYFGHHISTIEGGMICTNDDNLYNLLKMIRSHGWDRDLDDAKKEDIRNKWKTDEFSALYTFYVPGFNLRATDLQAFIGLGQLENLESIVKSRNENFKYYYESLKSGGIEWLPTVNENDYVSNFCFPIIAKTKQKKQNIVKSLQDNNVEVRPLIAGSMGKQPFYINEYGISEKKNCSIVDECGLYVPNHPGLNKNDIDKICNIILKNK